MRRLTTILALLAATAAIAACAASAPPGWTYAPAPASPIASGAGSASPGASSSAAPSAGASAAPSVPASAAPSAAPSEPAGASPSAGASGAAGSTLTVTAAVGAATAGFDPKTLETAANTPFTLVFDNQDNTTAHNLVIQKPDGSKVAVSGDDPAFFTGPGKRTFQVPGLAAGDYKYICEIHPTVMIGTLSAK
jgi:plastocyanin